MREYVLHQAAARERTFLFPVIRRRLANWNSRRLLRKLEQADDGHLHDIGLSRALLAELLRLPLDVDPIAEWRRKAGRCSFTG
jgi:uncharacterized protein YjiS (DUF1127 family)